MFKFIFNDNRVMKFSQRFLQTDKLKLKVCPETVYQRFFVVLKIF